MASGFRFRHLRGEMVHWLDGTEGQMALSLVQGWVNAALDFTGAVQSGVVARRVTNAELAVEPERVFACFERLVELGELDELTNWRETPDDRRVFVATVRGQERRQAMSRAVEGERNARHLSMVLVLTTLEEAGCGLTVEDLAKRCSGTNEQVRLLVSELYRLDKVKLAGPFVGLSKWSDERIPPEGS